jgi:RNA polymerase sigma factor (sigma-70 family)
MDDGIMCPPSAESQYYVCPSVVQKLLTIFSPAARHNFRMDAAEQVTETMSDERKNQIAGIVAQAGERLVRFIRARVPTDADAEDILQDVWRQLVTTLEDGPLESVSAWLYTVARNRITDHYRKPQMASLDALPEGVEPDDAAFEFPDFVLRRDPTPEAEELRSLFWEQLHVALAELPQEQRQVFVWHELEGLSFQDIAKLTGENLNTLLARKRYAVLHLRRRFQWLHDEFLT